MTTIDPAVIEAAARSLHEGYVKRAKRDRDWDLGDIAVADAARDSLRGALSGLSPHLDDDEVLVDYTYSQKHKITPRSGVAMRMNLLAATNRRFWSVVFENGALGEATPIPFDAITTETKRLSVTLSVEPVGSTWKVTGSKTVTEWIEGILRDRPQGPVRLLQAAIEAAATTAPAGNPPAWHPDPRGRHELRYWDGTSWTAHVSDQGVQSTDPV